MTLTLSIYIVTFAPNEEHADLMPIDGFFQVVAVAGGLDQAEQKLINQLESDEYLLDGSEAAHGYRYYTSNYGRYKIEERLI